MPKNITEDKENLKDKLDYIGLNLERIPKFLKEFIPFSFRPLKSYDETTYKVYKYINVADIQILLTPTDRLADLTTKYKLANPIMNYLDSEKEENIERYTTFLTMLSHTELEEIKALEIEQEKLKMQIPYEVKYANNYIWQIYYSDVSDKYFMLMPTNEYNNAALFYVLKKQIEAQKARRKELIYVPISHQEYSGSYLVKSQISDLENYLWYFTKEWPEIYELYAEKGKMQLKIVGKTKVYENIESNYVITLASKEEALEEYKLVKALFILATGLPEDYQFKTRIDEQGKIAFAYLRNNKETTIQYINLLEFIQEETNQKKMLVTLEDKKIIEEQKKLQEQKEEVDRQTEEYLAKQRQIATFLECKKTFFGKVKYYFSNRKKEFQNANKYRAKKQAKQEEKEQSKNEETTPIVQNNGTYTIEDLIEVCTKLDSRRKMVKNLKLDNKAAELKVINLERKIKNANIYLNEIELHKKSIFEFWKFTNKDELPSLNEGDEDEGQNKDKIGKSFEYENDIEDMGKQVDELQRRKLSKNEADSIFAIKQVPNSIEILNHISNDELTQEQKAILQEELDNLKKEYEKDIDTIKTKDFDIFGGMSEDITKIKMLNNQKHREVEKDKYNILNINPQTELSLYIDNLRNYLKLVKEAFCKISSSYAMPIYLGSTKEIKLENLKIFHLNQMDAIKQNKGTPIYLYKLNWKEEIPILYYSNIVFYDNFNQTLPVGMNVSDEVLVNLDNVTLKEIAKESFRLNNLVDDYYHQIVNVNVVEYDVKIKSNKENNKSQNLGAEIK